MPRTLPPLNQRRAGTTNQCDYYAGIVECVGYVTLAHVFHACICVYTYSVESRYKVNWGTTPIFHTKQVFHAKLELVVTMEPQQGAFHSNRNCVHFNH